MVTSMPPSPSPSSILKITFGYDTFLPLQREVIENILARRDSLAVMPTGGGKSLCYQIPALILPGLTVVVSPLIALMKDQVEQLRANGVPALFLNSTLSPESYAENMEYIRRGQVKLLYVAPETLLTPRIFALLDSLEVSLLTIDEAHCISEWGHDFRPEYRQLVDVRKRYPNAVCLALTATATHRVRADIKSSLGFAQSNEFIASFNRPNLYIEVSPKQDSFAQTESFLNRFKDQSGIIYCLARRQVDELAAYLASRGFSVRPYHAGLEDIDRKRNQEAFIRDDVQIIVATIAFGMGINKPNVRFVLHFDLPKSIEGYYQEIGRAGRDGLPAHCLLLYSYGDVAKLRYFIDQKEGQERLAAEQQLSAILRYAEDNRACRRKPLLAYFGENLTQPNCANCDNCTAAPPVLVDITIPSQKFLSCVHRVDGKFGIIHIIDVLRGSKNEKVLKNKHDQLSTYNIGADWTVQQWHFLARQLLQMGYLAQESEFHTVSVTGEGMQALKKRKTILGQVEEQKERAKIKEKKTEELEVNNALFALLRQKRKQIADEAAVPPYVIFSDRALLEMSAYAPQSPESFMQISGVGQVKARQYGQTFLKIIREYCQKKGISEKPRERPRQKSDAGRRYIIVAEAYNAGESVINLMDRYKVSAPTILDHLTRYVQAGNTLRHGEDLLAFSHASPHQQQAAFRAFEELGADFLKPAFDRLSGSIPYDELKILRVVYLATKC